MKALFLIVMRDEDGSTKIHTATELPKAICIQYALLYNTSIDKVGGMITDEAIEKIMYNLENELMDMIKTNGREVYILFFPPSN